MKQAIKDLAKRRKKWVEANRENEFEAGIKRLLTDLYPDNAHFIYELLQNAEDAKAQEVRFTLDKDRIEFEHNGERLFELNDVESITSIGFSAKRDDATNIGKFGVGFKAVFAYTETPQVESGEFNFRIRDMVVPEPSRLSKSQPGDKKTRFIIPFNNPKKAPEQARSEIERLLNALGATTLLFLTHIRKIVYLLPDSSLGYIERINLSDNQFEIRVQHPHEHTPLSTWFMKFDKEVQVDDDEADNESQKVKSCRIAVAFGLTQVEAKADAQETKSGGTDATSKWDLASMEPGHVCIYFPADKETSNLKFHLHAPFASTVARDSVRDCAGNEALRDHLADLLAESMSAIRDQGLLTVRTLALLPNDKDNLPNFYQPLMDQLIEEFKQQALVPMKHGDYAAASGIFRGTKTLTDLIDDEDLVSLLGDDYAPPMWVVNPPLRNQREDNFLSMLGIKQWGTTELVKALGRLNKEALGQLMVRKDDKWHQKIYEILIDFIDSAPKYSHAETLQRKRFIKSIDLVRCSDNIYRKGSECFFSAKEIERDETIPQVSKGLYLSGKKINKKAREFLETAGVTEFDIVAEAIEYIIPKYKSPDPPKKDEHFRDIDKLVIAYKTDSQEKKERLRNALVNTPFILSRSPVSDEEVYRKPDSLYFYDDALEIYFSGFPDVGFVSLDYKDTVLAIFSDLGVTSEIRVNCKFENGPNRYVIISPYKRGLNGFDPDTYVEGLSNALLYPSIEKSRIIWNKICIPYSRCIRGKILRSSRQNFSPDASTYEEEDMVSESFGRLLIGSDWLPTENNEFLKPSEISLDELPNQFERDENLANLLGMKQDVVDRLAEEAGISSDDINLVKEHSQEFKQWKAEMAARKEQNFPTRSVKDPERRQERLGEQLTEAPDKEYKKRETSIRATKGSIDPITWLRNQYMNDDDQMVCQICKDEMPFRKRDNTHYFEAKEVLSEKHLPKENEAQYLALCPLCAAKYVEFIKYDDGVMTKLKHAIVSEKGCEVPIVLGDEKTSIRFVESHLLDLKTIINTLKLTDADKS